jgi:hypothetical protein
MTHTVGFHFRGKWTWAVRHHGHGSIWGAQMEWLDQLFTSVHTLPTSTATKLPPLLGLVQFLHCLPACLLHCTHFCTASTDVLTNMNQVSSLQNCCGKRVTSCCSAGLSPKPSPGPASRVWSGPAHLLVPHPVLHIIATDFLGYLRAFAPAVLLAWASLL